MKKDNIITFILVGLIVITAAALRLYHPFDLPVTYDEMSAMFRTHYNSLGELATNNMMLDTHPIGVEVFLYYWTKLVGYTPLYVKLPFIICGILTVFYVFFIGKNWFNPTVGLICAAYMATLQFTIMHSQEFRPYGIGLFFTLGMTYHWSRLVFAPEKRFDFNWIFYILFSALCAYTHYFCLLMAIIVGFTGLLFIKKRYVLRYVTAGIMIFVLFIPHLHILVYQLTVLKGIGGSNGWLGVPGNAFVLDYLNYIFHFSPYVYGTAAALLLWGIIYSIVRKSFKWKVMLVSFLWFALPIAIGFFYSVYRNPVLQYRVLIFSFPFLLFSLFGMMPDVNGLLKVALVIAICGSNIFTLLFERNYYHFYYTEPIKKVCTLNDSLTKTLGKEGTLRFIEGDTNTGIREQYWIHKDRLDSSFLPLDNSAGKETLIDYLEDNRNQHTVLSYGCLSEADVDYLPIFLNYYPYVKKQYDFWGGNFYVFTSHSGSSPYVFESKLDFEGSNPAGWSQPDAKYIRDTIHFSGKHSYIMDSLHQYGPAFTYNLKDMIKNKNDIIVATAEIYPLSSDMKDVSMVAELDSQGKTILWTGESFSNYITKGEKREWFKIYHTIKLSDNNINYPNVQVKIYIWNNGKQNFFVDDFEAGSIKGNPYLYGIQEPYK